MFDQSYGLRFDIYERIQLSEEVAGIAELEEVELLPHIQVINQDEEATLRGHLLLTGLYRGEGEEEGTQRLEHYIPVEITVPLNRVSSLNEIAVEIENFDIDLLSKRSLNITGVLSLRGIESPGEDISSWNAEEFTVVHAPDWNTFQGPSSRPLGKDIAYEDQAENELLELSESVDVQGAQANISALHIDEEDLARLKDHSNVWQIKSEDDQELSSPTLTSLPDEHVLNENNAEREPSLDSLEGGLLEEDSILVTGKSESDQLKETDEKVEMKIALGSKKEPTTSKQDHVGLSSILNSSRARTLRDLEQQVQEEQLQAREVINDLAVNEEVEWKSLFLGGTSEKTPFSKVRLCIVQKEETIDLIADRYQMSSRELLLHNRLSEQTIEEGQILYIP